MNSSRIIYHSHPNVTPQSELDVLAKVYAYLLRTHDCERAAEPAEPCDGDTTSSIRRKEAGMT